jgi:hypothetical protein
MVLTPRNLIREQGMGVRGWGLGDGEMGRWGDGEMGNWGMGEFN